MRLNITIEGKQYEVEVEVAEPEAPTLVVRNNRQGGRPAPVRSSSGGSSAERKVEDEGKVCRSPLAGTVTEIFVSVGDTVEPDQPVLALEAMKMLTTITSPVAGTVVAIDASVGDAVKQGQLLVEFN